MIPFYPPPVRPFPQGGEESFLDVLMQGASVRLMGEDSSLLKIQHFGLELLDYRIRLALLRWAVPQMPETDAMISMGITPGGHPGRLGQILLELFVQGRLPELGGAAAWARSFEYDVLMGTLRRPESYADSLMQLLNKVSAPDWLYQDHGPEGPRLPRRAPVDVERLKDTITPACALHATGLGATIQTDVPDETVRDARDVVLDVIRRHAAGEVFPVPSLRAGDLAMLAGHREAEVRGLAISLAPLVDDVGQERRPARR